MLRKLPCVCPRHTIFFFEKQLQLSLRICIKSFLRIYMQLSFWVCFSCFDPWYLLRPFLSTYWTVVLKAGNFCFIFSLTALVRRPNQNPLISGRVLHTQVLFGDGELKKAIQNEVRKTCTGQGSWPYICTLSYVMYRSSLQIN